MYNPYQPYMNNQQIIKVSGEQSAQAYQMSPNSSALLLDTTAPRVFLVQTDGAGYKTINAYKLEPYTPELEVDVSDLVKRIEKIERTINAKSNTTNAQSKSKAE